MSTLDFRNLSEDRLTTTDSEGGRIWIIPARVRGVWKTRKTWFHTFLLLIFVLTPWLRIDGSPLVLFDILERQFIFFGHVFGAHDGPLLFFVLGIAGFSLIVATALWGRIWCGWACPQTVFIEQVFRRIETLVVGNRASQIAARKDPLKWKYFRKLAVKWVLFVGVSLLLAHTFIAYFVSWERLLHMMSRPPSESWTVFLFTFVISAFVLFDFAWFREQFCTIMCPYGRFQAVLMDQNSITVTYDYTRGEPRAKGLKKKAEEGAGDCIDCFKCVAVCPTGIDIRRGQQMECIGCTACIDACDEVMEKIERPKGLIRYAALADLEKGGRKILGPRLIGYLAILALLMGGFTYALSKHDSFYYAVLRQYQRPYVVDGSNLMNNFRVHLKNPSRAATDYRVELKTQGITMAPPLLEGHLGVNQDVHRPFFLRVADWRSLPTKDVVLKISYKKNGEWQSLDETVKLVFPKLK